MASMTLRVSDSTRDWPRSLVRNAAVIELAHAIFLARAKVFGGPQFLVDQPPHIRSAYITRADELLKTLEPARVLTLAAKE